MFIGKRKIRSLLQRLDELEHELKWAKAATCRLEVAMKGNYDGKADNIGVIRKVRYLEDFLKVELKSSNTPAYSYLEKVDE